MQLRQSLVFRFFVLLALLLVGVSPLAAQTQADEWIPQLEAVIQSEMAYYRVPGAAVAVIEGDQVVYAAGFGVRDLESGAPFTPQTRFRIGSTTKSMTSLLIAQLVDQGVLTWDTPLTQLLPDFRTADPALTAQIAVRDLMNMATGLINTPFDAFNWGTWTIADLYDAIGAMQIDGEFRNSHHYNNEVYALAGYLAAVASGLDPTVESYAALMQSRIFDPIGMTSALITDDHTRLGDNYALPYELDLLSDADALARMIDPPIGFASPSGAVWANIEDMALYVLTQMNAGVAPNGTRIVSAENLAQTWQPGAPMGAESEFIADRRYGMGWVTQTYRGIPMRWHNGGWSGYATQMAIFPESDSAILVFSNSSLGGQFNDALVYTYAELRHGLDVQAAEQARITYAPVMAQLAQIRLIVSTDITAEDTAPYLGAYEQGWSVEYRGEAGLWLTNDLWTFRLVFVPLLGQYFVINNGGLGAQVSFDAASTPPTMIINVGTETPFRFARVDG